MKKIYKRFLSLVVIAAMTFGNNVMCFAAEGNEGSDENASAYVDVVDVDISGDDISEDGTVDLAISPDGTVAINGTRGYNNPLLTGSGSNESSSTVWSNDFHTDRAGILHVQLSISGSCHINVKLQLNGSWVASNWVNETVSYDTADFYSQETISGGSYVKVTLNSFTSGSNWTVRAWVDN